MDMPLLRFRFPKPQGTSSRRRIFGVILLSLMLASCAPSPGVAATHVHTATRSSVTATAVSTVIASPSASPGSPSDGQTATATFVPPVAAETFAPEETTLPTEAAASLAPGFERLLSLARADLASRLSVSNEQIVLVDAQTVDWPDASLGCPQPDMLYAQVITPGYLIALEVEGQRYTYHTDLRDRVVACDSQTQEGTLDLPFDHLVALARRDLARRLGIPEEEISLVAVVRQDYPAGVSACGETAEGFQSVSPQSEGLQDEEHLPSDALPEIVTGEAIFLRAGERTYEYHAAKQSVTFCRTLQLDSMPVP